MTFLNSPDDFKSLKPGQILKIENLDDPSSLDFVVFDKFINVNSTGCVFNIYQLDKFKTLIQIHLQISPEHAVFIVNSLSNRSYFISYKDRLKFYFSSTKEILESILLATIEKASNKTTNENQELVEYYGWKLNAVLEILLSNKK